MTPKDALQKDLNLIDRILESLHPTNSMAMNGLQQRKRELESSLNALELAEEGK